MKKRPYSRNMGKDESRGARSGRNVRLTVMISEDRMARLEQEQAARSTGVRKASYSEIVEDKLGELPPAPEKPKRK